MVKVAHFSFSEEFFYCKILFILVVMDSKIIAQKSLITIQCKKLCSYEW